MNTRVTLAVLVQSRLWRALRPPLRTATTAALTTCAATAGTARRFTRRRKGQTNGTSGNVAGLTGTGRS